MLNQNHILIVIILCVIEIGRGIELNDGWSVDESLEIRKIDNVAARISSIELSIGDFDGGKNVMGITPIGFSVPEGSFHEKVKAMSNGVWKVSDGEDGSAIAKGNLTYKSSRVGNKKYLDVFKSISNYHVGSTYYISCEIVFRVDERTTHLLMNVSFNNNNKNEDTTKSFFAVRVLLDSHADERLLGFGNQPSYTNLKGTKFSINAQENGLGRGDEPISLSLKAGEAALDVLYRRKSTKMAGDSHTTYSAVPAYISSDCRVVIVDSTNYIEFDSSKTATEIALFTHNDIPTASSFRFDVFNKTCSWGDQVISLTEYTGRQHSFPNWALEGFVAGVTGGSNVVRDVVKTLVDADVPLSAVWIQDWAGRSKDGRVLFDWQVDVCYYPDWWDLVHELKLEYNVSVLSYVNPFFATDDVTSKCEASKSRKSMFQFLKSKNWLVIDENTGESMLQAEESGSFSSTIDLTNSNASTWMRDVVLRCQVMGLSEFCDDTFPLPSGAKTNVIGFMADFGEHLPYQSCKVASGKDAMEHHNEQPMLWSELTREAISNTKLENVALPFHRSGNAKSPESVLSFWAGDQEATWGRHDGIASLTRTYISSGLSGWGNMHTDIGGMVYSPILSVRDVEILKRWFELASVLDPILRSHPSNGQDHVPQPWSSSMIETTRKFSRIHVALKSYKRKLLNLLAETGLPLVRHTLMCCDVETVSNDDFESLTDQLMLGNDLMIAPVVKSGAKTVSSVLIPPPCSASCGNGGDDDRNETWYNIWKGPNVLHESGTVLKNVDAALGFPAVFVRRGSDVAWALSSTIGL